MLKILKIIAGGIIPDEEIPKWNDMGIEAIFGPGSSTKDIIKYINGKILNKEQFLKKLNESDIRSVARLITLIENEDEIAESILKKVWKKTGNSYIIGVTGPPGAGKSTIVDSLAKHLAESGKSVGILAVDPTSPFSGGAVLGDRLRMSGAQSSGIFIRSVASRGSFRWISCNN